MLKIVLTGWWELAREWHCRRWGLWARRWVAGTGWVCRSCSRRLRWCDGGYLHDELAEIIRQVDRG
ncbi:MAG: hypothetical protein P1T08_12840 [Acidimicrobiia bacterium]|nr:hypothetical protein [Acidimicrobiia bacterium]